VTSISTALASALAASRRRGPAVVSFECALDVEALLTASGTAFSGPTGARTRASGPAFLWDTRGAETLEAELTIGLGAARSVDVAEGSERPAFARLFEGLEGAARPRAFGAVAFDERDLGAFSPFGRARFTVPTWTFTQVGPGLARAIVVLDGPADEAALGREAARLDAMMVEGVVRETRRPRLKLVDEGGAVFLALAERAAAATRAGDLEKVVIARRVELAGAASAGWALSRLRGAAGCVRFGFALREAAFVGASPEVLVVVDERGVRTEAVAGSEPRRGADLAEVARLLVRDKDRREHALVVDAIRDTLGRVGAQLEPAVEPRVRTLRHVHHLVTPIAAHGADLHPLELVRALHPTPALGGVPRERALSFLREHEGFARGMYAAPIGWVDAGGRGSFVVGIRSALLLPAHTIVFAGAGIVRGSLPSLELAETTAKLRAMLEAAGASAEIISGRAALETSREVGL
jgi:isochorismate synthase